MARPVSGKIRTCFMRQKQDNGDIYVYERQTQYDPKVQYTRNLSYKLIGKIIKGTTEIVPTRPKRKHKDKDAAVVEPSTLQTEASSLEVSQTMPLEPSASATESAKQVQSEVEESNPTSFTQDGSQLAELKAEVSPITQHVGSSEILEWIGQQSGIDEDLLTVFDRGTANKLTTIARYWLATGLPLSRLETWQMTHPTPCTECLISRSTYQKLFKELGQDEGIQHEYFRARARRCDKSDMLAIDSTTVSTYSENLNSARFGYNKDSDGLPTVKLLTAYSINSHQPIATIRQPGNIPDGSSIKNALKQLGHIFNTGDNNQFIPQIITDNGFCNEQNMALYVQNGIKFLTLIKTSIRWVHKEIEEHRDDLEKLESICPFDKSIRGLTVKVEHEFTIVTDNDDNTIEKKNITLYLHIYLDRSKSIEKEAFLSSQISDIYIDLKNGVKNFTKSAQNKIDNYIIITKDADDNIVDIKFNNEEWNKAKKDFGIFCLVSNKESDPFEALRYYRLREKIEELFSAQKRNTDGDTLRVWTDDSLKGRIFAQFISLGYWCYYNNAVKKVVARLKDEIECHKGPNCTLKKKLLSWLTQQSLVTILDWFDCIEVFKLRTQQCDITIRTESTQRDRLFIKMLKETAMPETENQTSNDADTPA